MKIYYRVFKKDLKKMIYVNDHDMDTLKIEKLDGWNYIDYENDILVSPIFDDILMISLGSKDKNGKLIYEDDIIRMENKFWVNDEYGTELIKVITFGVVNIIPSMGICFKKGYFSYSGDNNIDEYNINYYSGYKAIRSSKSTIIGDIHQNIDMFNFLRKKDV